MGSPSRSLVDELSGLELHAFGRAVTEHALDKSDDGGDETSLHVDRVLSSSISGAEGGIERTGE